MGVSKKTTSAGNGLDIPKQGDTIVMSYTGYLFDQKGTRRGGRGRKFDTSTDRGDLSTKLGGGSVIRGTWYRSHSPACLCTSLPGPCVSVNARQRPLDRAHAGPLRATAVAVI